MTPAQLNVYARARSEALAARQRLTAANLYNLATMIRGAVWGKHGLPPFEKMFPEAASARSMWCIILTVRKTMWTQEVCT